MCFRYILQLLFSKKFTKLLITQPPLKLGGGRYTHIFGILEFEVFWYVSLKLKTSNFTLKNQPQISTDNQAIYLVKEPHSKPGVFCLNYISLQECKNWLLMVKSTDIQRCVLVDFFPLRHLYCTDITLNHKLYSGKAMTNYN